MNKKPDILDYFTNDEAFILADFMYKTSENTNIIKQYAKYVTDLVLYKIFDEEGFGAKFASSIMKGGDYNVQKEIDI